VNLQLGKRWQKKLKNEIEGFEFEVGVLEDKPHRLPVEHGLFDQPALTSYAGGPVRKATRIASDKSVGEVLVENMERMNLDLLLQPFKDRSSDILRFTDAFLKMALRKNMSINRVENLLQAIVRNPILKQKYGPNRPGTADAKGFDRHLFDTGQMFKAITARAKKRV
jgi:hypothetical protein